MLGSTFLFLTREDLARLLATALLGATAGALLVLLVTAKSLDTLHLENEELKATLREQETRLERFEEQLTRVAKRTVVYVDVEDERAELELRRRVTELLDDIVGRELTEIDPTMVHRIVEERPIDVGEQRFLLRVRSVLVSGPREELIIYIEAVPDRGRTTREDHL